MNKEDQRNAKTDYRPSYKWYIERNEGSGYNRENISLDRKSDIIKILKPRNDTENKSLTDKLLVVLTAKAVI